MFTDTYPCTEALNYKACAEEPSHMKAYRAGNVDSGKRSLIAAKLLSRKFICKELLRIYIYVYIYIYIYTHTHKI